MKTSVFAIDVGYGNTKYAHRASNGAIATGMFPSLAPLSASDSIAIHGGDVHKAGAVTTIVVSGIEYQVGPDVFLDAAYGKTGRTLSNDFVASKSYDALLFGAFHFAQVTHVERLMLGLPVHTMSKYAGELRDRLSGKTHNYGPGRVTVDKVVVIPQPLGSLVAASANRQSEFGRDSAHLVIDVGYFTTDWVYANGFTMDDRRSNGMPGGVSQVYQRIAQLISKDQGDKVDAIELIDKALREQKPYIFYGNEIDLLPYLEKSQPVIAGVVDEIKNIVGPLTSVRSIVLSGGGASLYAPAIRKAFPRVRIEVIEAPCTANAKGFLIVGEAGLTRERAAAKA
ncbi:PRTRC system protein D [Paraburkholderia dilworthii]|uniref:PRTRC system protein D n=1 Tax=Paraburkholderia dilworthii TaxID=948106 RepID=UPI00040C1EBD|nr:PRTRC system protein D [Paraburkholderia dilworthii]